MLEPRSTAVQIPGQERKDDGDAEAGDPRVVVRPNVVEVEAFAVPSGDAVGAQRLIAAHCDVGRRLDRVGRKRRRAVGRKHLREFRASESDPPPFLLCCSTYGRAGRRTELLGGARLADSKRFGARDAFDARCAAFRRRGETGVVQERKDFVLRRQILWERSPTRASPAPKHSDV